MCEDETQEGRRVAAYWDGHKQGGLDMVKHLKGAITEQKDYDWDFPSIISLLNFAAEVVLTTP